MLSDERRQHWRILILYILYFLISFWFAYACGYCFVAHLFIQRYSSFVNRTSVLVRSSSSEWIQRSDFGFGSTD